MILEDFEENISENECKFLLSKFGAGAKSDGHKDGEGVASRPDSIKTLRQQVTDLGATKHQRAALHNKSRSVESSTRWPRTIHC